MAGGGGFGYLGHCLVLAGVNALLEAVFTAIKKAIEYLDLVGRQRLGAMVLPEAFLDLQSVDPMPGLNQAVMQGVQEPLQPRGNVEAALLGALKDAVVA